MTRDEKEEKLIIEADLDPLEVHELTDEEIDEVINLHETGDEWAYNRISIYMFRAFARLRKEASEEEMFEVLHVQETSDVWDDHLINN